MSDGGRLGGSLRWAVALSTVAFMVAVGSALAEDGKEFDDPSLLISTEELAGLLNDLSIRIVDLRPSETFQEGRIPFAVSLPAAAVLDPTSRINGVRRSDAELAQMFGQMGIGKDTRVVLYDDKGGHDATRVLWILQYLGHQSVSVLDGGFPKWQAEGRHITDQIRRVSPEQFPVDLAPRRLATADWILAHKNDPDVVVLDVRPAGRYVESHIPSAINLFWKENLNDDDTWKSPEELRTQYEALGVTKDKNIVVYCQGGAHNAHTYLTLKALGYPRVRSYDRAWPEWGGDPSLPKVAGTAAGPAATGVDATVLQRAQVAPTSESGLEAVDMGLIAGMGLLLVLLGIVGAMVWQTRRRQAAGGE